MDTNIDMIDVKTQPKVSVIIPVYNAEQFLRESIESILNQTFTNFELIIIDDASTDSSFEIIQSYSDSRIRVFRNEINLGSAATMNKGIKESAGEYVARMDADDISLPHRLEKQVTYLDTYEGVYVVGSWVKVIGDTHEYVWKYASESDLLSAYTLFICYIAFPSVMMRKKLFTQEGLWFKTDFRRAEDFEVWARASHVVKLANIPEVLLNYRVSNTNTSNIFENEYTTWLHSIYREQLQRIAIVPSERELYVHRNACLINGPYDLAFAQEASEWFEKIYHHNERVHVYNRAALNRVLEHFWYALMLRSIKEPGVIPFFARAKASAFLSPFKKIKWGIKWVIKCIA